jgi:hypothetical protein
MIAIIVGDGVEEMTHDAPYGLFGDLGGFINGHGITIVGHGGI